MFFYDMALSRIPQRAMMQQKAGLTLTEIFSLFFADLLLGPVFSEGVVLYE